jgi:hypothetical protein
VPSEVARFSERRAATKSKDDAPKNW